MIWERSENCTTLKPNVTNSWFKSRGIPSPGRNAISWEPNHHAANEAQTNASASETSAMLTRPRSE